MEGRAGPPPRSYADAGVDIDRATGAVGALGPLAASTHGPAVLTGLGLFAGFYRLDPAAYRRPILVASIDGVGTKLALARTPAGHEGVGYDLVAHCVNDIAVHGAEPLFFLDYFAQGRLVPDTLIAAVRGMSRACREAGCALIGGETAEMPGLYAGEDFDLAGSIVGVVEEDAIVRGADIQAGDRVLALAAEGLHTNGFSLARRVLLGDAARRARAAERLGRAPEDVLLERHRMYLAAIRAVRQAVRLKGAAHVTGGGLVDNLPRILPAGVAARIETRSWTPPAVFEAIAELGAVPPSEMYRTFNMGIGMALVVSAADAPRALAALARAGEMAWEAGAIVEGESGVLLV